jgi:type IV secretion system protein TrbE
VSRGAVSRGYLTQSVLIYVPRKPAIEAATAEMLAGLHELGVKIPKSFWPAVGKLTERMGLAAHHEMQPVRQIVEDLNTLGLTAEIESWNATEVVKGTIPGDVWSDVTRHGVNSAVCSAFMSYDGVWQGSPHNPRFGGPCIAQVRTGGTEPFFLNLHPTGNVGHFFAIGGQQKGKTSTFNTLRLRHMQYPGAQVFGLEVKRGGMVTTLCMGGHYVELGTVAVQPLRHADAPWWRARCHAWLMDWLSSVDEERAKDPDVSDRLWDALQRFADTTPIDKRDLTTFSASVNDFWVKRALKPLTRDGAYGNIFDGIAPAEFDHPVVTFDLTDVMDQRPALPALVAYLFNLAASRVHPERPMMLLGDEAALLLEPPFSTRLKTEFRTFASQNVQMGLATHSAIDVLSSELAHVVVSSSPTRFYFPDPSMGRRGPLDQPGEADALHNLGLLDSEIEALASASGRQIMIQQTVEDTREGSGVRFIDLNFSEVQRAIVGRTTSADVALARRVLSAYGRENFLYGWLLENSFKDEAERLGGPAFVNAAE